MSETVHEHLNRYRDNLVGRLKINVLAAVTRLPIGSCPALLTSYHPDLAFEIVIDDQLVEIVAADANDGTCAVACPL